MTEPVVIKREWSEPEFVGHCDIVDPNVPVLLTAGLIAGAILGVGVAVLLAVLL